MWIRRQQLTPPALTADGKINAELADAQLGVNIHPARSASAREQRQGPERQTVVAPSAISPAWSGDQQASRQLLRARALSASVDAERKRRDLNAERGKYTLTEEANADLARVLSEFLLDVEQSFLDFAGDDRDLLVRLRKWWRALRSRAAEKARIAAAAEPKFMEDPAA
jgi:hypothetical protein